MHLVLFDLDHTLLPIDSASTWSRFLIREAGLDEAEHGGQLRRFDTDYRCGKFDIEAYLAWQLGMLTLAPRAQLESLRATFLRDHLAPHIRPEARALIERHRARHDTMALVTGTHAFLSAPIAEALGLQHVLAVRPEELNGRFTGRYVGTHTYQQGKVRAVLIWLSEQGLSEADVVHWTFYSDSINDLPLMDFVAQHGGTPVVTHGDARLRGIAVERGWPQLQLFDHPAAGDETTVHRVQSVQSVQSIHSSLSPGPGPSPGSLAPEPRR